MKQEKRTVEKKLRINLDRLEQEKIETFQRRELKYLVGGIACNCVSGSEPSISSVNEKL